MLLGTRVTKHGLGAKHAAPSKAQVKQLRKQLERKRQETLQLELLEDERAAAREAQMLSFGIQAEEAEAREELTRQVMSYTPWVLGGVGLMMAAGVVVTIMRKPKKKGRKK